MKKKKKIMIVDDEEAIIVLVSNRLRQRGYEVVAAHNGTEALSTVEESKPNLIVLDVRMPPPDGFSVLQTLKRNTKTANIPVIMLTAQGQSSDIMKAQELRAEDYVIKPFEAEEFLKVIEKYI